MRREIKIIVGVIAIIGVAIGAGWLYFRANPDSWEQFLAEMEGESAASPAPRVVERPASRSDLLMASGSIEAEEVTIAAEIGGRVVEISAVEGDEVNTGDGLLRLDQEAPLVQLEGATSTVAQAQAAVETAQAQLSLAMAGATTEEIEAAEAAVNAAQAAVMAAEAALVQAEISAETARTIQRSDSSVRSADAVLAQAEAMVAMAQADLIRAEAERDRLPTGLTEEQIAAADATVSAAEAQVAFAEAGVALAEAALSQARAAPETRQDQVALADASVSAAQANVEIMQGQMAQAEALLARIEAGASAEEIAVLEAQVNQAEAALVSAETTLKAVGIELARTSLSAPSDGIILQQLVHEGELAFPGAPLLTLADLDEVTLTVYVPEADLGRVSMGQFAEVTVDAYDETFIGRVSHISSQAEFTPRNVQTQEERVHMVFAVKVRLANDDHRLKPGMPADAAFN
jgi:HlyD family secretion protein